jgi:CRP/FNR family transcriptional regulator, cyclic AMP receptor protein
MLRFVFEIEAEKNCPLYAVGERLLLTEKTLACPQGKEVCLILVRDMTELLFKLIQKSDACFSEKEKTIFNCSGCQGLIKFSLVPPDTIRRVTATGGAGTVAAIGLHGKLTERSMHSWPLLEFIPPEEIAAMSGHLREISVLEGSVLIKKGEKNLNLYSIMEGEFRVEDGDLHLATLTEGDLCGEMSYLGADVAVSTVLATKNSKVLAIAGDVFGRLFGNNPAVQSFMAQLLAVRLRRTNAARAKDFESCMSGRIDKIVPAELLQIFHMHQKTGVLTLEFSPGSGSVVFREGGIIGAEYCGLRDDEAVFKILTKKNGRYRFTTGLNQKHMQAPEIGDFMMLLMEGVQRVDEDQEG